MTILRCDLVRYYRLPYSAACVKRLLPLVRSTARSKSERLMILCGECHSLRRPQAAAERCCGSVLMWRPLDVFVAFRTWTSRHAHVQFLFVVGFFFWTDSTSGWFMSTSKSQRLRDVNVADVGLIMQNTTNQVEYMC